MAVVGRNIALEESLIKEVSELVDYAKELGVRTNFSEVVRFCLEIGLVKVATCYEELAISRRSIINGVQE